MYARPEPASVLHVKIEISKEYGKLFLPCGIFNINEPMVYSMPLMLNPLFLVPLS